MTFFEGSDIPLYKFVQAALEWTKCTSQRDAATFIDITTPTINSLYKRFRLTAIHDFDIFSQVVGGPGRVVEIDESLFMKVKYGKGKDCEHKRNTTEKVWVFGMYERSTTRCLFFIVKKRDAVNLLNIIYKYVAPGTKIISDSWRAYRRISALDHQYTTDVVNHKIQFVNERREHMNSIESSWSAKKQSSSTLNRVFVAFESRYV